MRLVFSAELDAFKKAFVEIQKDIQAAAGAAVKEAAAEAVTEGRANIASAGFPARWQKALTSRFFPNTAEGNPAAIVFHKIPFAGVFERGATIRGQPLLWLPIEANVPRGVRSPRQYKGVLVSVNVAGKPPLLFDADERKTPLFFGIESVKLRKRFNLYAIFARAIDKLHALYFEHLRDIHGR